MTLNRSSAQRLVRRHALVLAYIAALIPALVMAVTQPVWSLIDEAQHADFILQLSHGNYPLLDRTLIDRETVRIMQSTGVFTFWQLPGTYPVPDVADMGAPPPGMSQHANAVWMSRHLWQLSDESEQPPVYYVLMVPIWSVADAAGGTLAAVYAVRIVDALLIALLAPLAIVVAWRLAPGRAEIAAMAALLVVLLPGLALNATRVSNDGLAAVLGGATIALGASWVGGAWNLRRALLLGLALGIGVVVKVTLLGLGPAWLIALLWPARGASLLRRLALAVAAGAVVAICLGIWFAINWHLYGVPVPSARASRISIVAPKPLTFTYLPVAVFFLIESYWTGEPFGTLPFALGFATLGALITLVAAAGLVRLFRARRLHAVFGPVAVALAAVSGMLAFALLLPVATGFPNASPGRYLYPAVAGAAALCALGMYGAMERPLSRRALSAFYGLAAVVLLCGGALNLEVQTVRAGPGTPPAGANTLATDATGRVGGLVIHVDQLALDSANKATWVHVSADNTGSTEAEWTVTPVVSAARSIALGDYSKSTHLAGDVDAGQSVTGWLFVPLDPKTLSAGGSLRIRFPDVAVDAYQTVDDIVLVIPVSTAAGGA